jgi:hypothetical protein
MALDKITTDFATIKSNGTFDATFTTSSGTVTISYGDLTTDTSNSPSHTFSDLPPYILNTKTLDDGNITGISISGNNITSLDVSRFENATNINVADNLLPKSEIGKILEDLDYLGQEDGVLTITGNLSGGSFSSDELTSVMNLDYKKGWEVNKVLWHPSELALAVWYDASDVSSITVVQDGLGNDRVSQWNDKSGNGRHALQGTQLNQFYNDSTINGLNAIRTAADLPNLGAGYWTGMVISGANIVMDDKEVHVLVKPTLDNTLVSYGDFTILGGVGNHQSSTIKYAGTNYLRSWNFWTPGSATTSDDLVPISDVTQSFGWILDSTGNGYMLDGEYEFEGGTRNVAVMEANRIGNQQYAESRGLFGEVIITDNIISQDDRDKLHGYLAWKWGTVDRLPSNHPYKELPPTV